GRDRIAVHAGADARKRDRRDRVLACEGEALLVARRQELRLLVMSAMPDGADGMNDMARGKVVALRDFRLACLTSAQRSAFVAKLGPRATVDRTVDATAAKE